MTDQEIYETAVVGLELWRAQLIGTSAVNHRKRFDRMQASVAGDLVIETSTSHYWSRKIPRQPHFDAKFALGYLVRIAHEELPLEEGYDEAVVEKFTYIRLMDGTEFKWHNANFVTILPVEGWNE